MALEETLARLGIDGRRARFYLAALELGEAPITAVAQKAGVSRTTAYDLLARLLREGLVTRVEKSGRLHVLAEDPAALLRRLDERRALLTAALPELRSVYNRSTVKPRIHFYEGAEGIRTVLLDRLQCRSRRLRGILSMQDLLEAPGRREMDRLIALRIEAGIHLQAIRSRAKEVDHIWPSSPSDLRELRYAPEGLVFAMTTYIYDHKVSFISTRRESFGMIVESEEFAALQENYFEVLWRVSEPAPVFDGEPAAAR
ncbi:MAG TPA: helix-turn-helix domain-containing protein [Thermodesulfobacteriota bacterium]